MTDISIEVKPENEFYLEKILRFLEKNLPYVSTINLPESSKYDIKPWNVKGRSNISTRIPHVISRNFNRENIEDKLFKEMDQYGITDILVNSGWDKKEGEGYEVVDFMHRVRERYGNNVNMWVTFDQHNVDEKSAKKLENRLRAGAKGVFTQPVFSKSDFDYVTNMFADDIPIYVGIAPITSEKELEKWEREGVKFSDDVEIGLDASIQLAKELIEYGSSTRRNVNFYIMTGDADMEEYLTSLAEVIEDAISPESREAA